MHYRIEAGLSRFTVRAFASGLLSALAHNPTFAVRQYEGDVAIDPAGGDGASMNLTIAAASLELTDDVSSRDQADIEQIMRDQVLETAKYPTIEYASLPSATRAQRSGDGQFAITMNGDLTLHGASRRQPVSARVIASPTQIRAYGEFPVRQTDYNIRLVTAAGGAIKVKDELTCTFDIVANVSSDSR
jgi:polyisoprenoid-binding protein YceI